MPRPRPLPRRRKAPRPPRWWRGRRLTAYGREAISVLVLVGTLFLRDKPALPVAKREEDRPPVWATDVVQVQDGGHQSVGGIPLPPGPLKDQQRPPCGGVEEYAINGGCWVLAGHAPCSSIVYAHGGRCYLPSRAMARIPTSLGE